MTRSSSSSMSMIGAHSDLNGLESRVDGCLGFEGPRDLGIVASGLRV